MMSKWSPFIEDDQPEEKSIPLWVHLKNVPTTMVSWEGLSFITSPVGVPIRLHPETAQCINIKTPKVFVNAYLTKELPKKIFFNLLGKETLVECVYPWLPTRCSNCMKWGHLEKTCLAPKKTEMGTQLHVEIEEGEILGTVLKAPENMNEDIQKEDHREDSSPTKQLEHEKDKDQATVSTELEEVRVVETEQTLILGKGSEEDKNDEGNKVALKETEWSDVTPGKASRSPKKINSKVEQSLIISNSRFSVLAFTDEDGEEEEMVEIAGGT